MVSSSKFIVLVTQAASGFATPFFHPRSDASSNNCNDLQLPPELDSSFEILSVGTAEVYNYTDATVQSALDFCNVTVTLTHPGDGDYEIVRIWLPLQGWNGRFQAIGGGGLAAGFLDLTLAAPLALGYAAGSSEAGLTLNQTIDALTGAWVLNEDNTLNVGLLENFAHRSTHDMTIIGKALAECFYGTPPAFSYYTGCSQGGRQGYFAAQYHPDDFDGIMANSPAVNLAVSAPSLFWPPVVMENIVVPPPCVFNTYLSAIIEACDPLDGVVDGLISNTDNCHFDTQSLVGSPAANCTDDEDLQVSITITVEHAEVISKTLQGPRSSSGRSIWWGVQPGAPFYGVANTTVSPDGDLVPLPFAAATSLVKYFAYQDPSYDTTNMTYADWEEANTLTIAKYTSLLGNEHPDLSTFQHSGGKLLTWHGMADQYIPHPGSVLYRQLLESNMGGAENVNTFHRLFLVPGALHCGGAYGPEPTNPLGALVDWVEKGIAPDVLPASNDDLNFTRNWCPWPQLPKYDGSGDVKAASSFSCQ